VRSNPDFSRMSASRLLHVMKTGGHPVNTEVLLAESRLVDEWVRPAIGPEVEVRFGSVGDPGLSDGKAVVLTLLDIAPSPASRRGSTPPPLQLRARYLVTVRGFDPTELGQCLAELAFLAGPLTRVELEPLPPSPTLWESLGTTARPALIASVLLERERRGRKVSRVREPLITRWSPAHPLTGVVMGPGDIPIAGALVEVEGFPLTTYSNHRGEFAFRSVPGVEPPPTLVVSAKGTHLRVRVGGGGGPEDPVLIRVPIPE
jgi:hypothetical protein